MADKEVVYTFLVTVAAPVAATEDDTDFYTEQFLTSPEGIKQEVEAVTTLLDRLGKVTVEVTGWTVRED